MKPRVFVSSVVEGFEAFRAAAREGIVSVGGEPVLVNEDFPSLATSSRNACLDAVDSSDMVVSVIGERGGWQTPSGKLVVEEEYERALTRKLPVLVFIQKTTHDVAAAAFIRRITDYIDGAFRRTFGTPRELRDEVERALRPLVRETEKRTPVSTGSRNHFARPYSVQGMTMLRLVLTPERNEEVIDPVRLNSAEFRKRVYSIAHADGVNLLTYERPKTSSIEGDDLVIVQTEPGGRHGDGEHVRVQLSETGELIIDANVSGRVQRGDRFTGLDGMVVAIEDIETVLRLCFSFAAALYEELDPYKRHQRFQYNVALSGLGYRNLERNPQARASYTMNLRNRDVIRAFETARWITRPELREPTSEIQRTVELLVRRAAE
ncbi:MAG: DUF4062 domain-containing protein [Gemmatimonadaceae bacterium]